MPRLVGSNGQRKAAAEVHHESCILEARDLVNEGEADYATAGQKLGIPPATVFHHNHGRRNTHQAQTERAASLGLPAPRPVGVNWFTRFRKRHPDMRTALSERKDVARSKAERDPRRMAAFYSNILCIGLPPKTSGISQPLDVSCFKPYQLVYGRAADGEVRSGVCLTKQDFPRLLPRARAEAFTRTNIVQGFEQTGIFPFNDKFLGFMRDYYTKLDKRNSAADSDSSHSPSGSRPPSPMTPPHQRGGICSELNERVWALSRSPPETPSAAVEIAKEASYELERAEARISIQHARTRELQAAEKGRNKKGDRRWPLGDSRIFDQAVLNQLREARDERDKQMSSRGRGRGRGGGRGRGRGSGARGGGRGRGSRCIPLGDIQNRLDSDSDSDDNSGGSGGLPQELVDAFDGHPPKFVDDVSKEASDDSPVDDENRLVLGGGGTKRKAAEEPEQRPGKRRVIKPSRLNL
ncbi:hypothetical protein B0H10DRAFT_1957965 [Mycena sp. CBHHK59/15]|nr:hypothetical protein B0H10DRAFT_1957965 [Mycena sp. CBHHK59/15]